MLTQTYFHLRPSRNKTAVEGVEQLMQVLAAGLEAFGYQVDPVLEDWGWWVGVAKPPARMAIGLYGVDLDSAAREFAVTVFTEKTKRWVFWPFVSHSIESELVDLKGHVAEILRGADEIEIIAETDAFPL